MRQRAIGASDDSDELGCLKGEEQLRSLLEQAPAAIAISRHGLTVYNNPRFLEMFGYQSNDEVRGHPITEQIAPEHRERTLEFALRHDRGLPAETEFETVGLRRDGTEFPFHVAITRVDLSDGPAILGFFTDITDRKKVEDDLRQSHYLLSSVVENTSDAIFVKDRDGKYLLLNPGGAAMVRVNAEDAIGKDDRFVFPQEVAQIIKLEDQEVMTKGETIAFDTSVVIHGRPRTFSSKKTPLRDRDGNVIGIIGISRDITEEVNDKKRINELAVRAEGERLRLRTILDTLPIAVAVADAEGKLIEENAQASNLWSDITPGPIDIGGYGGTRAWSSETGVPLFVDDWPVAKALSKGETVMAMAIDIQRLDGTIMTMLLSAAPLRDAQGRLMGAVSVAQDITHQRQLEHEAVEARERAELYIDLLTHDINNMNAGVTGYLQLLMVRDGIEEQTRAKIQRSLDILENSSHLIENVKKIQRLETGGAGHGPVDLGWLLEDAILEFRDHAKEEVTISYLPQLKRFVIASELLKDVFTNIIGNAVKHAGGPVTIEVRLSKAFEDGKEFYRVSIEDNGPGIPDEMKDRVFSRLQRGRTRASGAGLGLYLVRRLVEDYHGRVWVEDRVPGDHSRGARFVVLLPVIADAPP